MTTAREWLDDMEQMTDPDCCSECARTRLVIAALRAVLDLPDVDVTTIKPHDSNARKDIGDVTELALIAPPEEP